MLSGDDCMSEKRSILLAYVALLYGTFMLFSLMSSFFGYETDQWSFFYYYSFQTNILVTTWLLLYSLSVFRGIQKLYDFVTLRVVMTSLAVYMAVVYLIVIFILEPALSGLWIPLAGDQAPFLHITTPMVMWMYYFLIPGRGSVKPIQVLYIEIYPALFLLANLVIGANVNFADGTPAYAYDFINPSSYDSLVPFVGLVLGLLVFFSLFGLGLLRFKQYINKAYFNLSE
jgi:hypothetical protein